MTQMAATDQQRALFARVGVLAFNPHQRRGPDGRWIKMDVGELKAPRRRRGGTAPEVPAVAPPVVPDAPRPSVGFKPRPDKEWALMQKRLGKRTPRLDPEGDLQPGDVVPTRDGNWTTVEGGPVRPAHFEGILVNVKDDSKGYRHTASIEDLKLQIERYAAEKAWREANASDEGAAYAQLNANRRPGEPEIQADGRYAKPTKQYATWNGETYTRTSRNPYRYAAVVASKDHPEGFILSWHRTEAGARRGTLEASQRDYFYVKDVVETGFQDPGKAITAAGGLAVATRGQRALFDFAFNPHQRRGPDGRWIRMPTNELKAPKRRRAPRRPRSHVDVKKVGGRNVYTVGGRDRKWTPAEARAVADALDATVAGDSVPPPVAGRIVSDGVRRRTVEQVQPFRGANGNVILDVGRDSGKEGSGEVELTNAEARKLAQDLREHADREEGVEPSVDPPGYAAQLPPVNLPDPQVAYREARDEYNMSVYNVAWTHRQKNQDRRRPDEYLDELMKEYDEAPADPKWVKDEVADHLRIHLDSYYDGQDVLDPRPDEDSYLNVPSLPPGHRTAGGARPPVTAAVGLRQAALDRSVRSGLESQTPLAGGIIGDTRRVQLGDGTEAIYKRAKKPVGPWSPEAQTDAEGLASLVAEAVGVRAPAVKQASPTELYMEVMPGTSAAAQGIQNAPIEITDADDGLKMGLLDVLLNNSDRHTGNWMLDGEEIAAIDHGFAFMPGTQRWMSSPFTDRYLDSTRMVNPTSPLSPSDISYVRQRLEQIKPQFEAMGRGDWYRDMLLRLNQLDSAATSKQGLYPRTAVTAAQRAAFAQGGILGVSSYATRGGGTR